MKNFHGLYPLAPLGHSEDAPKRSAYLPQPHFATMWRLATRSAQKRYAQKNTSYGPARLSLIHTPWTKIG